MVSAWPELPSARPAEPSAGATAGASSERKRATELASDPSQSDASGRCISKKALCRNRMDDNILHSPPRSLHSPPRSLHSPPRSLHSPPHSLHRSKENILHRSKENILHRSRENILHRNIDIHSKHVYRRDDRPGERPDGRVHSTEH